MNDERELLFGWASIGAFGWASIKEEGAPIDPLEAIMWTGPGATPKWFMTQCHAFFDYRRSKGDSEDDLRKHLYYLPSKGE